MGLTGVELLREEWQKLVDEREHVLREVHEQRITFMEWNRLERAYAVRVHEALTRLKHAQARSFCREMVGQCGN